LKTNDLNTQSLFQPSYPWISSAGPVTGHADKLIEGFFGKQLTCTLTNNGITKTIPNVVMKLESLNEFSTTTGNDLAFGDIQPGEQLSGAYYIILSEHVDLGDTLQFQAKIYSNEAYYWIDTLEYTISVSITEKADDDSGIRCFPNPANDQLTIQTSWKGLYSIEMTSLNGQLLYSDKIEGPTHQIDLSSLQKGLYFITVTSKDFVRTEKIIKL